MSETTLMPAVCGHCEYWTHTNGADLCGGVGIQRDVGERDFCSCFKPKREQPKAPPEHG